MLKRLLLLGLLALSCLALCGCGYSALERQSFAICMSIDGTKDGKMKLGIQAPKNGKGDDSGGGSAQYEIFSATADTLPDALRLMAATTPYPINLSQLRICYIAYDYATKTELRGMLRYLDGLPTMRPDATVMISLGGAFEAMKEQKPEFGMRMSTHLDILIERLRNEMMLPNSTISHSVRLLGSGLGDPLFSICAVNPSLKPKEQSGGSSGSGGGGGGSGGGGSGGGGGASGGGSSPAYAEGEPWSEKLLPEDLLAGMLPRESGNPVEYLGMAAVSDGRVSGLISASRTQLVLRAANEMKKRVIINGEGMTLRLTAKRDSMLDVSAEEVKKAMETLLLLDCDALCFGQTAMGLFSTDADWNAFGFRSRYRRAEIVVDSE